MEGSSILSLFRKISFAAKSKWERRSCLINKIYWATLKAAHHKLPGLQLLT